MEQKNPKLNNVMQTIEDALQKEQGVLFCYLFGSFARGNAIPKSDVDVALYLSGEKQQDFFQMRLSLIEKLTRALGKEVDVVVLNTAFPFLKYAVLKEGILVFERDPRTRIEFELRALNEYFDYKPILELYRTRLRTPA